MNMYSKLKFLGHPIHPMLVAFPIALYVAAFLGFVVYAWLGDAFWFRLAFVANIAAVLMATGYWEFHVLAMPVGRV
jgi:uncharacterized membrane protein